MSKQVNQYLIQALRKHRQSQGLSQKDAAKFMGITQSHLSKIEQNKIDLRLSTLIEYARLMQLELQLIPQSRLKLIQSMISTSTTFDPNKPLYSIDNDDENEA